MTEGITVYNIVSLYFVVAITVYFALNFTFMGNEILELFKNNLKFTHKLENREVDSDEIDRLTSIGVFLISLLWPVLLISFILP